MWRFGGKRHPEAWETEIAWPIGDIEAADLIRTICRSAADTAARVGGIADTTNGKRRDKAGNERDRARYQAAARRAICLKADDMKTAKILFRAIQANAIREIVLSDHPALQAP